MLFKSQYYYLIAGLPDFTFDSMKLPFTVEEFKVTLDEVLKEKDKKLLRKYFLKYDNDNLISLLNDKEAQLNKMGSVLQEDVLEAIERVKEDLPVNNKDIPPYYEKFIMEWLEFEAREETRLWEDLITSLYMDYGVEANNLLLSKWFELNLNIGNLLSAIYARKYNMDVAKVVVGNNEIAKTIRENANMRDFGLSQEFEYYDTILRLSEDEDIFERERKLDKFRWEWLDENTVYDYFNIEYIFAYMCKLQILERWVSLNAEEGERVFRELISGLKENIKMPEE